MFVKLKVDIQANTKEFVGVKQKIGGLQKLK
jgi:hypothetical protein